MKVTADTAGLPPVTVHVMMSPDLRKLKVLDDVTTGALVGGSARYYQNLVS